MFVTPSDTGACGTAADVPQLTAARTKNGYRVSWRYVTNDGKYVLVNDTHNARNHGRWLFIRRTAFGALPATPAAEDNKDPW